MLVKLVDLFSFLSVVLRAGTLVFQSVLLGGVLFVLWIARRSPDASDESIDRVQASSWKLLRLSAVGLAIVQLLYLYVDSAVLMASADIGFQAVVGANFFISGSIVLVAALLTAIVASRQQEHRPMGAAGADGGDHDGVGDDQPCGVAAVGTSAVDHVVECA